MIRAWSILVDEEYGIVGYNHIEEFLYVEDKAIQISKMFGMKYASVSWSLFPIVQKLLEEFNIPLVLLPSMESPKNTTWSIEKPYWTTTSNKTWSIDISTAAPKSDNTTTFWGSWGDTTCTVSVREVDSRLHTEYRITRSAKECTDTTMCLKSAYKQEP